MSWQELINDNVLTITTGDGKVYTPKWKNAKKSGNFNSSKFDFLRLKGTFIYRGEKPGDTITLQLFFDGIDCIDIANEFEISLDDKRPIRLEHPYYGIKNVQPLSKDRDDSFLNVTRFNLTVFETIETSQPEEVESIEDTIEKSIDENYETSLEGYVNKANVNANSINSISSSIDVVDSEVTKIISVSEESAEFKQLVGKAVRAGDNILTDAKTAIDSINNLLEYPSTITATVASRVVAFKNSLERLSANLTGYTNLQLLEYFTTFGSSLIGSTCKAVINPQTGDYKTRQDVLNQIVNLSSMFDTYVETIDAKTGDDASIESSFAPDSDTINSVYSTYVFTVANLQELILDSKIENTTVVDVDTNLILLAHKYYGLESDDSTIDELIELNDFKRNEFIQVKRGTIFKYLR